MRRVCFKILRAFITLTMAACRYIFLSSSTALCVVSDSCQIHPSIKQHQVQVSKHILGLSLISGNITNRLWRFCVVIVSRAGRISKTIRVAIQIWNSEYISHNFNFFTFDKCFEFSQKQKFSACTFPKQLQHQYNSTKDFPFGV